jgi:hypothetical protein
VKYDIPTEAGRGIMLEWIFVDALLRRPELPGINTEHTNYALFILERLDRLTEASNELAALLRAITPDVAIGARLVEP